MVIHSFQGSFVSSFPITMRSIAAILAFGLIAVAQAQEQCAAVAAKVPQCAVSRFDHFSSRNQEADSRSQVSCIAAAASGVGCGETDFACQCSASQSAVIASSALPCVLSGCGAVTGLVVQSSALAVCQCAATVRIHRGSLSSFRPYLEIVD